MIGGKKVYVAGPYTKGDPLDNTRRAICVGNYLAENGLVPFIPHLTHFWHEDLPHEYQFWVDYDNEWLPVCDVVYRIHGESKGSDAEERLAKSFGIPIFYDLDELISWSKRG